MEEYVVDITQRERFGIAPFNTEDFDRNGAHCNRVDQFFSSVTNLSGKLLYNTEAHRRIYSILISQSNILVKNRYVNRMGENCVSLFGQKGIGKSTALRTFVTLSKYAVPALHVIYVNLSNFLIDKELCSNTLLSVVLKMLSRLGLVVRSIADNEGHSGEHLVNVLRESKVKLLLIVDELDQLYKIKENIALKDLQELSYLANQSTGTVAVTVCGSTALMEFLITASNVSPLKEQFPLLAMGPPNLNEKFPLIRMPSNIATDLKTIATLAGVDLSMHTINWVRLIAFTAGADWKIINFVKETRQDADLYINYHVPNTKNLWLLLSHILKKLYNKNATLFNVFKSANDIAAAIATTPWEKGGSMEFQPLIYVEVEKIWNGLIKKKLVCEEDRFSLDTTLLLLADSGSIVIGNFVQFHPSNIYPISLLHVLQLKFPDMIPTLMEKIVHLTQQNPNELVNLMPATRSACRGCIVM